jgi:phospholipid/cholesterol/gamma-HCH transport system substrate-binding protein
VKSFTERNPLIIGAVALVLIAVSVTSVLVLNAGVFKERYTLSAHFADAAGLRPGDRVRVAGVPSGEVASIQEEDGQVEVVMKVDSSVELSGDTRAEVVVETVLGTKHVRLVTGDDWEHQLEDGDTITETDTPVEVFDLQDVGTRLFNESDGRAFDAMLESLTEITEGKRGDVQRIIDGANQLTEELERRDEEARALFDAAETLTQTLAERDDDLLSAVDDLNVVVGDLAEQRAALESLLENTASAAGQLADLAAQNRPELDAVITQLRVSLETIDRHQLDLAQGVAYLGVAVEGFASIGYSGPDEVPVPWGNVFTQLIGPTGPDGVLGACGPFDRALDLAFGPDPLPCDQREGQFPVGEEPGSPEPQESGGPHPPEPPSEPPSSPDDVSMLLVPLLTGGAP